MQQQEVIKVKRPDFSSLNQVKKGDPINDFFHPQPKKKKKLTETLVDGVVYIDLKN
ncbi:MAG: hypothetical protein NE330_21585 [Lentisphaeraceae bacterium]|nr:hypothetical protein [Lentisphaeraceae bacterium]